MRGRRKPTEDPGPRIRLGRSGFCLVCCALCVGVLSAGLLAQQQRPQRPVPELDRVTLKSGRALVGLIVSEEADRLMLKMKLPTGFISFTLLKEEVTGTQRASPAGRALSEAEWKKLEQALARRARSSRRSPAGPTGPAATQPPPQPTPAPQDPRDILLAEARRLGLKVPPEASIQELQRLVQAEQTRRHEEAVRLFDQAVDAFSEASAELPNLAYYHRPSSSAKLVYREAALQQALKRYDEAYKLFGRAAELDPTAKPKTDQYRANITQAGRQMELLVRLADMVEEAGGNRRTNPHRR